MRESEFLDTYLVNEKRKRKRLEEIEKELKILQERIKKEFRESLVKMKENTKL